MSRRAAALASAALAAACSSPVAKLVPVIEAPIGTAADPYASYDRITLAVAPAGATEDLVSATFAKGLHLSLPGVPYDSNLVLHMTGELSGVELSYGRTCAFDLVEGEPLPSPHLYYSRTANWAGAVAPPTAERIGGSGWPVIDGSGVFVGGVDRTGAPVTIIDHFDPRTGTYDAIGGLTPRIGAAVGTLGDGRVVVIGGKDPTSGMAIGSIDVVDPLATPSLRVVNVADARAALTGATAVTQQDGSVAVLGGRDGTGALVSTVLVISATAGAITVRLIHPDPNPGTPREGAVAVRLGTQIGAPILVVGGTDDTTLPVATADLYQPLQENYSSAHFAMKVPRARHGAALLPDGSVLVIGGVDAAGAPVRDLEEFSLYTGFVKIGTLPASVGAVDFALTTLPDGRVLVTGGRPSPAADPVHTSGVILQDKLSGVITTTVNNALPGETAGAAAVLLCDGTVLTAGGVGLADLPAPSGRYDPPSTGRR